MARRHDQAVHDRRPIIGNGHAAGIEQFPDFRKFLPFRSFGNGTDGKDPGFPGSRSLGKNKFRNRPGIVDGHGIGHATHRGKAAGYSRRTSRGNRFLMLESGLSKVDVQIHKPGTHEQTFGVDRRQRLQPLNFLLQVRLHRADFSLFDQHVGHAVPSTWVDNLPSGDQDLLVIRHTGLPPSRRVTPLANPTYETYHPHLHPLPSRERKFHTLPRPLRERVGVRGNNRCLVLLAIFISITVNFVATADT